MKLVTPPSIVPPPAEPQLHPPLGAPLRRYRPVLPAQLSSSGDGVTYLWSATLQGEVSFRSAPNPASGDWWQNDRSWSRTDWDIALSEGGLYRLIRIGDEDYIEGEYD